MRQKEKEKYIPPTIEVMNVESEGVIAASNGINSGQFENGGSAWGSSSTRSKGANNQNYSSLDELGDLINDILTFEK